MALSCRNFSGIIIVNFTKNFFRKSAKNFPRFFLGLIQPLKKKYVAIPLKFIWQINCIFFYFLRQAFSNCYCYHLNVSRIALETNPVITLISIPVVKNRYSFKDCHRNYSKNTFWKFLMKFSTNLARNFSEIRLPHLFTVGGFIFSLFWIVRSAFKTIKTLGSVSTYLTEIKS